MQVLFMHRTTAGFNPTCHFMITQLPPLDELLDLIPDAVCAVDSHGLLLYVNASFERVFGYAPADVMGRQIFELVHPDDRERTMQQADIVTAGTLQRLFRNRYLHKDGHSIDIQWSARWLPDYGVRLGVGHEVTELRHAERELEHRASHDLLTGLPNRHQLQRELKHAIAHPQVNEGSLVVLYLDLDGFKAANDRGGHDAGDHLLCDVARRLQLGVRQGDLVARVGGDEFVILLVGCRDAEAARAIAGGLRARLGVPYMLPDGLFRLDVSIGLACFPADGSDPEALVAHADRAMYAAKRERQQY